MRRKISATLLAVITVLLLPANAVLAQNLSSTNYTLVQPVVGEPLNGVIDSSNYNQLLNSSPVSSYTTTSSTYSATGGTAKAIEANVPSVQCFETTTNNGSTTCTGLPGAFGMQGVCSQPGCYDRAKLEINSQNNADDTRYAVQISTSSSFVTFSYVDSTTRFLKATLSMSDFVPKCEWEGTIVSGICNSANTTWQRYNIFGLDPNTTYYVRMSAQHGSSTDASFTQSAWGPSASATTANPSITLDVDIAANTSTPTNPPFILSIGTLTPAVVNTAGNMIIFRLTSNSIAGITTQIKGLNGALKHTTLADNIPTFEGDLAGATSGYGLRNNSSTNSALNSGTIGSVAISSSPSDFTDSGATDKVGQVPTSLVKLFDSGGVPLDMGVAGFKVKVKPSGIESVGSYRETLTFITVGVF